MRLTLLRNDNLQIEVNLDTKEVFIRGRDVGYSFFQDDTSSYDTCIEITPLYTKEEQWLYFDKPESDKEKSKDN